MSLGTPVSNNEYLGLSPGFTSDSSFLKLFMAQVFKSLSSIRENHIELPASGFDLTQIWLWWAFGK